MGRLDNIIARNRRPNHMRERLVVSLGFGAIVLLILALMVFTDLGKPPGGDPPAVGAAPVEQPAHHDKRVDGVMLRRQPAAKPARAAQPSPQPQPQAQPPAR